MKRPGSSIWGTWPAPSKISRRLPGSWVWAARAWGDRDDRVALAPDDHDRHRFGQVEAVEGGDTLAVGPDDRPQGREEGLAALAVGERGVGSADLGEVGIRLQAEPRDAGADPGARLRPDRSGPAKEEVGAGQGGGAQDRADVGPEAAAGDQHQPFDHLRELVGELQGDAAAEAVADHRRALVAERQHQVAQPARQAAEAVVAAAGLRGPVAGEVGGEDRVAEGQRFDDRLPVARRSGHAMDEQQQRAIAGLGETDAAAVDRDSPGVGDVCIDRWHMRDGYPAPGRMEHPVGRFQYCRRR